MGVKYYNDSASASIKLPYQYKLLETVGKVLKSKSVIYFTNFNPFSER